MSINVLIHKIILGFVVSNANMGQFVKSYWPCEIHVSLSFMQIASNDMGPISLAVAKQMFGPMHQWMMCSYTHAIQRMQLRISALNSATIYSNTRWHRGPDKYPDSKVHGANMGPTWVLSAQLAPCCLAIRVITPSWNHWCNYLPMSRSQLTSFGKPE